LAVDHTEIIILPESSIDLLAHYSFDSNDARDGAVEGLAARLRGDAAIVTDPDRGLVLALDGEGDYVDCGNDGRFDIENAISIAAWVKVRSLDAAWQPIIAKGDSAWRLQRNKLTSMLKFNCAGPMTWEGGNRWSGITTSAAVDDGRWHHVAGVYDGSEFLVYVDGKLDASREASGPLATNRYPVCIGENFEQQGSCWNGWIDDVRIYGRALSAEEVARLHKDTN
jgi:hypothetical protein